MSSEDGIVAVITGSTRGIGRGIAEALLARGDRVVVSGRSASDAEVAARELTEAGPGTAVGIACDVRDPGRCRELVRGAVDRFGGLDLLVNNAGLGRFAAIQEMDPAEWEVQIRTNLDGAFHCSQAAIPHLAERGGWILNVGSLAGRNSFSGGVAYSASKWGLLGMSESMMLDLRHEGIRVCCIMPGSVNTHFFGEDPDPAKTWMLQPEDIARVVVDLLAFPDRALPSRIEIRPTQPPRA